MTYVFDTYALMVHFRREAGFGVVDDLLQRVLDGTDSAHISIINVGELYYMLHRKAGTADAERSLLFVQRAGIVVEQATGGRVMEAARLKASVAISYADAFAATLAQELGATLVTGDPEFRVVAGKVSIMWLSRE